MKVITLLTQKLQEDLQEMLEGTVLGEEGYDEAGVLYRISVL